MSIGIGIATLVPLTRRAASDGRGLLVLLRGGNAAREHAASLGVASAIILGMDNQAALPLLERLHQSSDPARRAFASRVAGRAVPG